MDSPSTAGVCELSPPDQVSYGPRRFTVDEYYRMEEAGILTEDDRVELIVNRIRQPPGL